MYTNICLYINTNNNDLSRRKTIMLDMKLNSGKLVIDDDNQMHVDEEIQKKLKKGFEENEDNKDKSMPEVIKD